MFLAIFNYIEHLFALIKPKKLFYMAIDGVAPRAKMNQQRSRRFRTALDAEKARKKAIDDGVPLPSDDPFDSNCITPGTVFMEKLTKQLRYFIHKKVSEDASWQGIDIILSGHEVPGEGEHKIMEKIRHDKASPDYDSNIRHCLYGLDADLIMLGLLSHDPHFAILREEVTFGRQKKSKELADQRFYLLHLSLVREYLDLEFDDAKDSCNIPYNFERVLDDFILINFFIGNDFLPELPSLLINDGALPTILQSYKRYLQKCTSYISDSGLINFDNLRLWLNEITVFEYEKFEEKSLDVDWFAKELSSVSVHADEKKPSLTLTASQKKLLNECRATIINANSTEKPSVETPTSELPQASLPVMSEEDLAFIRALAGLTFMRVIADEDNEGAYKLVLDIDGVPDDEDESSHEERVLDVNKVLKKYEKAPVIKEDVEKKKEEVYSHKFQQWRNEYYRQKFGFKENEVDEKVVDIAENYIEGLQWVLLYYYRGCPSWGWYFRYHYSPRITDIKLGLEKIVKFEKGSPFKPFEQLMGVLPSRSKALVPPAYHFLMTDDLSPIKDFYPLDFALDMNGKRNEWEAVVKIPFVDEKRLLKALETRDNLLTSEEKKRNGFGNSLRFVFNPQVDEFFQSSLPGHFLDIAHSHCLETIVDPYPENAEFRFGLLEGAKLGIESLAGFPSLETIPYTAKLEMANVEVFQQPSRNESVVITLKDLYKDDTAAAVAEKLCGDSVYINWPFLREAKVVAVSDDMFKYSVDDTSGRVAQIPHEGKALDQWSMAASRLKMNFYKNYAVKIGAVDKVVHVKLLKGLKKTKDGAFVKDFDTGDEEHSYAAQTLVENVLNEDDRYKERAALPLEEEYPIDSQVIFLGATGYGNPVTVKGYSEGKLEISLLKLERKEPAIGERTSQFESKVVRYIPSFEVAKILHIPPLFLSKITGRFMVEHAGQKVNLGLNLKNDVKRLKVLGYTRKSLKFWEYTLKTIDLIKTFREKFPVVFAALLKESTSKSYTPELKLSVGDEEGKNMIKEAKAWLKDSVGSLETVDFETEQLSTISVTKIEDYIIEYFKSPETVSEIEIKNIPRDALLLPSVAYTQLRSQRFDLGDRVVSALDFGKVKLYNRGTVIGIDSSGSKVVLKVLFDQEFDQGSTLNGLCKTRRGLVVDAGSVINLTNKQLVYGQKANSTTGWKSSKPKPSNNGLRPAPVAASVWRNAAPDQPKASDKKSNAKVNSKAFGSADSLKKTQKQPVKVLQKRAENSEKPTDSSAGKVDNEAASEDLMAMLQAKSSEPKPPKDNNEVLSTFKGTKNVKASHQNLMGALINNYSGMPRPPPQAPQPPPGAFMPPLPFGFMPPPPPPPGAFLPDDQASADLMAHLNINGDAGIDDNTVPTGSTSGRGGRGRGRGTRGARGSRGGRGNGRGRGSNRGGH